MGMSIIIFTLNGCEHCSNLMNELTKLNIKFIEIEISQNKEIWDSVVSQTGHNVLPSIFIRNDENDTGPVYVPGRDFESQEQIVEIIKLLRFSEN